VILDAILAHKREEVAASREARPLRDLEQAIAAGGDPQRDFRAALRQAGVSIIAEIKRRSPSGGELRPGASARDLAQSYAAHGAAALSVLTDARFFGGTAADLQTARSACSLPVLRKDFLVDEYQIFEARALGADAILLIVRALSAADLRTFLRLADDLGLHALVETHNAEEVQAALDAGARIVGVNNRDLDTLVTDPLLAPRLRSMVPPECVFVAESGISRPEQIACLAAANVDAVLIGEALVRAEDPGTMLEQLVTAGRGAFVPGSRPA
jgi:indole-3-glycerol phosphate synthase